MRSRRLLPFRHIVLTSSIAVSLVALGGCSGSPNAEQAAAPKPASAAEIAQQHVESAEQLRSEGKPGEAVEEFTAALAALRAGNRPLGRTGDASLDADVLFQRGLAYLDQNFPDTAAADFSEVIRLRPDHGAAFARRGQAYVKLGDLYKAVRDCTEAIRWLSTTEVDAAPAYRCRGEAYLLRGQYDRSVADLEKAVELVPALDGEVRPLLARAYFNWSRQLATADDAVAAEAKLVTARALDPELVAAAEQAGAPPRDDAVQRTAAKEIIDDAQPRFDAGIQHFNQQRYQDALAEFTAAIDARPSFAEAYLLRGETLLRLNFPDTAVKDFEDAVRYGGESVEANRLLAEAFLELGSPHRAVLSSTDALHADPLDAPSYALRGRAYVELGTWSRAITDLEEAVQLDGSLADEVQPALDRAHRLRDAERAADEPTPVPLSLRERAGSPRRLAVAR